MELGRQFEEKLEAAALDQAEQAARSPDGPVAAAIAVSKSTLRTFSNQYDIEPVIQSLEGPTVTREEGRVVVRWSFEHPAAGYFEFGTSDHTVEGNPVLSFTWEGAPQGAVDKFSERWNPSPDVVVTEVEVSGIDEVRFTREGMDTLRGEFRYYSDA